MALDKRDVRTAVAGDVVAKIVDTGGSNELAINGAGAITEVSATAILADTTAILSDTASIQTAVELIDDSVNTDGAAIGTKGLAVMGTDGTNAQIVKTDSDGNLQVDVLTGGGGTEYNEDEATPGVIAGLATMIERDDIIATVTPAEGDWIGLRGSEEGALWTQDFNSDSALTKLTDIETNTNSGAVVGGGVEATALRVTIASDSTGVLSIDDAGGTLTVDQSTHDNLNVNANMQLADTDVSAANPVPVTITDTEPSGVTSQALENDTASLAAQASETLAFALGTNVTASLQSLTIASEVPWKAILKKVDETPSTTTIATFYGESGKTFQWIPRNPKASLHQVASDGAPTAKYEIVITNNGISGVGSSGVVSTHLEFDEVAN